MTINFSEREQVAIKELAEQLDISEEKVIIHALRQYQLRMVLGDALLDSPGCGDVE